MRVYRDYRFFSAVSRDLSVRPSVIRGAFSPCICEYRRDLFSYIEEINDKPITSRLLSPSPPPSPRGNPPVVPRSIHMRGPYVCNRIVNSEHGPRVPVPIQVVSSTSRRRTHPRFRPSLLLLVSSRVNSVSRNPLGILLESYVPLGIFYKCLLSLLLHRLKELQICTERYESHSCSYYSLFFRSACSLRHVSTSPVFATTEEIVQIGRNGANEQLITTKLALPNCYVILNKCMLIIEWLSRCDKSRRLNWIESGRL